MIIDDIFLDELSSKASENERLRINFNLHQSLEDDVQRLFNALEPGTFMPIHRHKNTDETYMVLRGKLEVVVYNDNRELINKELLSPENGMYGIHIEAGNWHSINVLEKGTVIFEVKKGPYSPLNEEDVMVIDE